MYQRIAVLLLSMFLGAVKLSAQDSSHMRISLLTCTPGAELYATFGHSAIRVTDSSSVTDVVFNYGTFEFDDPSFYTKFIRGKLLYYVSAANFSDFVLEYQETNRGITEQVLNLTGAEKIAIHDFLYQNILPANRFYKYDFFFDNCTTRLRDIIQNNQKEMVPLKRSMPKGTSFRNAIHQYLDQNNQAWSKLGIDILLGAPCDAIMTTPQTMFLPDNLMHALDSAKSPTQLVLQKSAVYPFTPAKAASSGASPALVFSTIAIVIFLISLGKSPLLQTTTRVLDSAILITLGLLGILLLVMWTCTDHNMCRNNFNILWAWPTNCVAVFFMHKKTTWAKRYAMAQWAGLSAVLLGWFFLPQLMNPALIPMVLLQVWLAYRRSLRFKNN